MMGELNRFLPLQINFALEAKDYQFCITHKKTHSVLFYQYTTHPDQHCLSVIPDGCADIQFSCNPTNPAIHLCGSPLKNKTVEHQPGQLYLGVRFSPSTSRRIGWLPYPQLTDKQVSVDHINIASHALLDQLSVASTFTQRVHLIDEWLTKLAIPGEPLMDEIDYCLSAIHRSSGNLQLSQLAKTLGISDRRLRQKFTHNLGITPKLYCRIQRFQQALHFLQQNNHISGLHLTRQFQYYDESHLIKEFQRFSQYTPQHLHSRFHS